MDTIELLNDDLEERAKDLLKLRPFVAPFEVARIKRVKNGILPSLLPSHFLLFPSHLSIVILLQMGRKN